MRRKASGAKSSPLPDLEMCCRASAYSSSPLMTPASTFWLTKLLSCHSAKLVRASGCSGVWSQWWRSGSRWAMSSLPSMRTSCGAHTLRSVLEPGDTDTRKQPARPGPAPTSGACDDALLPSLRAESETCAWPPLTQPDPDVLPPQLRPVTSVHGCITSHGRQLRHTRTHYSL